MNNATIDELVEVLKSTFDPRMSIEDVNDEVRFALPSMKKIAKHGVEMSKAASAIRTHISEGTHGPLIALGIMKKPKYHTVWMANISTGKELSE